MIFQQEIHTEIWRIKWIVDNWHHKQAHFPSVPNRIVGFLYQVLLDLHVKCLAVTNEALSLRNPDLLFTLGISGFYKEIWFQQVCKYSSQIFGSG